jgi:hypothetical protein
MIYMCTLTFQIAQSQTRAQLSDRLLAKINAARCGIQMIDISRKEIFHLISKLSEEFRHFALLQR